MPAFPSNALVGLGAALAWGGGDFSGGMSVKAAGGTLRGSLRIILMAHAASLAVLILIVFLRGNALPSGAPLFWGLGAGVAAGLSLTAFYLALAQGVMGASAAVSGLLAAGIPVVISAVLEGAPGWMKAAGFVVALFAIWLIAAGPASESSSGVDRHTLKLALFGGVGFGVYFVALQRANVLGVFETMTLARIGSVVTCLMLLALFSRRGDSGDSTLGRSALLWSGGVAVLDTAGNLLFIAATKLGRLDVAAVLASLYPASTILLAAWYLHERPTRRQVTGMCFALVAVVLITV